MSVVWKNLFIPTVLTNIHNVAFVIVRDGDTGTYLGELVNNVGWKKRQEIGGSYI